MDFEDLLSEVGDFGKYQKKLIACFMVPTTLISAIYVMNVIFMVAVPDHWCHVPQLSDNTNLTLEQIKYLSLPRIIKKGEERYSRCKMYDIDYDDIVRNLTNSDGVFEDTLLALSINSLTSSVRDEFPTVQCVNGWRYDNSLYASNAVTKVGHFIAIFKTPYLCMLYDID